VNATTKTIVKIITFAAGLFFILEFLIPGSGEDDQNFLSRVLPNVSNLLMVIAAMAFLLGPLNLVRSHLAGVANRTKGWHNSLVFLLFLPFGIFAKSTDILFDKTLIVFYHVAFYGIGLALGASSMAILAFYLVSASYRAFRLSNVDSAVMMASAVIVLLGLVPFGDYITSSLPTYMQLREGAWWILTGPNVAVQRAVLIGTVAGAFSAGLRNWLSLGKME
jgi:hypothetical protein